MAVSKPLTIPEKLRRGAKSHDEDEWLESGKWVIQYMIRHLGLDDLGGTELLDMGCGTKFTQAILHYQLPIKHYTGIDVYGEMITHLQKFNQDEHFDYHHMDIHNEMYNPSGVPLGNYSVLPLGNRQYDVICLFSVFTHLAPHDYPIMLRLLRRHIKPTGKLLYTLFLNEYTQGGHGLVDDICKNLQVEDGGQIPNFVDLHREPLKWAVYSREYALKLLEDTGWRVESVSDPLDSEVQHHIVCTAA